MQPKWAFGDAPIRWLAPLLGACVLLGAWEWLVRFFEILPLVLPAPSAIAQALYENFFSLLGSALATLRMTAQAFLFASVLGIGFAILFSESRIAERILMPYTIILQVTPIVAIAPLVVIWAGPDNPERAVLILATIVAFFPVLSNTVLGLKSADRNLRALFQLYGASRWQVLRLLTLPSAMPNILAGLKISGGLALIGAIVAEFVAGSGAATGLAWRISEAGGRLQGPKMFAALVLLSVLGIGIYAALSLVEWRVLRRWHEIYLIDKTE